MAGDFTRHTFRPSKDYSAVLMQQGRVTLDADANEQAELLDRRLRAGVVDLVGDFVIARDTPGAFLITVQNGAITIGPGRAYVDGLLVENHGAAPWAYDPVLGELTGTGPVDYHDQPYLPGAQLGSSGTYIVYLDAFDREVGYLQDPNLLEKAIAVDTAGRTQNVWQVKLLETDGGATCGTQTSTWDELIAPSAGRLTTAAVGVPVPTDPCTIPPAGGYRGTENRLYRVEVHDAGPLGAATFKWSRDNASIATSVTAIDATRTQLTATRVGRDGVARIRVGDWVEVIDDARELGGVPGDLRQVAAVDDVRDAVTLTAALSSDFDATDPERHTRVIRWDQAGAAVDAGGGSIGVPAAAGTPIVLEDGVQISFAADPASGTLRTGDYWVFAARTADASVEQLVEAPPLGIHHHYARLAVVTLPGDATDCRPPSSGGEDHDCACDVCVTPESHASGLMTIQHAVDSVRARGGKVCLQVGLYRLDRAVRIHAARSVEVQGKGAETLLLTAGREPAFDVERSLEVTIDRLSVLAPTSDREPTTSGVAINLRNTIDTVVERCWLLQLGAIEAGDPGDPGGPVIPVAPPGGDPCPPEQLRAAIAAGTLGDVTKLFGPKGRGGPLIQLGGLILGARIEDNVLGGSRGIAHAIASLPAPVADRGAAASEPAPSYLATLDLDISGNTFACYMAGVQLAGLTVGLGATRVTANTVLGCVLEGIAIAAFTATGAGVTIAENLIRPLGNGIVIGASASRVERNDITRLSGFGATTREGSLAALSTQFSSTADTGTSKAVLGLFGGSGIIVASGFGQPPLERVEIVGNRVARGIGDGIRIICTLNDSLIADNQLTDLGGGGVIGTGRGWLHTVAIERNLIRDVANGTVSPAVAAGIAVLQSGDVTIAGNTIDGIGVQVLTAPGPAGIAVTATLSPRIAHNAIRRIGPPGESTGLSVGIAVDDTFLRADVLDNDIRRADRLVPKTPGSWIGIVIGTSPGTILLSGLEPLDVARAGETVRLWPAIGLSLAIAPDRTLAVRGNAIEVAGDTSALHVDTGAPAQVCDNRVQCRLARSVPIADVKTGSAIVASNALSGAFVHKSPALELVAPDGAYTVLGNICDGPLLVNGAVLGDPWKPLNIPS